jgi:hypothetical protein
VKLTIGAEMVLGLVVVAFQGSPPRRQRWTASVFRRWSQPRTKQKDAGVAFDRLERETPSTSPREVFPKDKVLRTVLLIDLMPRNRN